MTPPYWGLLERELLSAQSEAVEEFYEHFFDERGYQKIVPRWGGDDGPDDAAENVINWPMLHALGASDSVLELYKKGWDGHLRQYSEAKTVEVPLARDGMYYKEFITMFDWFHTGEALSAFTLQGLSDPLDSEYIKRTKRFSGFYMNEDPGAPNYDPEHRIIRSMMNGSRGPLLRESTALDWAGDPIDVEGRFIPKHGERNYEEMLSHFDTHGETLGDNPMNLGATTLALNAYLLTGEQKYKDWVLEYVDAWVERIEKNNGLIPTNIGLDGTIGGAYDGKWYKGTYGWDFSLVMAHNGERKLLPSVMGRCPYGFGNALLLTGDRKYIEAWRGVIETVNSNAKQVDGQTLFPHMYGDDGWYDFNPDPFNHCSTEVYYWSMKSDDQKIIPSSDWIEYLEGGKPSFPEEALISDLASLRGRMKWVRQDSATPDTRMSDDCHGNNPAIVENLTQLMLGGLPTGRVGYPLHCRLRYFDPENRRAGLPSDVAALIDSMSDSRTSVTLVNLNPVNQRKVIVQGGAYGEHQIITASANGNTVEIKQPHFGVTVAPGSGSRIELEMKRYSNQPTFAFPWF